MDSNAGYTNTHLEQFTDFQHPLQLPHANLATECKHANFISDLSLPLQLLLTTRPLRLLPLQLTSNRLMPLPPPLMLLVLLLMEVMAMEEATPTELPALPSLEEAAATMEDTTTTSIIRECVTLPLHS
jgi:hypothetical protein